MSTYKNSKIKKIKAREILDSRGNPTVEVDLTTDLGKFLASVPSGVSKGKYEVVELRDGGKRYHGQGVIIAVNNVNKIIAPKLKGKEPAKQKEIDNLMIKLDGTKNKSKLGANAILAVSQACCRAGAKSANLPLYKYISRLSRGQAPIRLSLPAPSVLLIEGGVHAGNDLDFQEFMIIPKIKSFRESLRAASEIYQELKNLLRNKYGGMAINLGDEGGFASPLQAPEQALNLILKAVENLGYQNKIKIILDIAASQFYRDYNPPTTSSHSPKGEQAPGKYKMKFGVFTSEGLLRYYSDLIQKYPILGLEDPFSEEDWEGFQKITKNFGKKITIIGDDLLATNSDRIKEAYTKKACNGLILKPNQVGTVSEVIEAARLAKSYGWKVFVKQRGGETNDDFIADLAVGLGADGIMTGAPARGERIAKYNRLLRIEEEL